MAIKSSLPGLKEKRYQQKKNIIGYLYKAGEASKPEICRFTNMTTPTISRIIGELMEEGWVVDIGQGPSIGGKRPHIFSLNPDAAYIIGVDIGRELLKVAIFNLQKKIIGNIQIYPSLLESQDNSAITEDLKAKIIETLKTLKIPATKIKAAGFSLPGLIDNDGNSYTYLTYKDSNIRQELEKILDIPVFIENDSTIMAMAEHTFGIAANVSHALCININECIGMGMILNSQPYTGCKGLAGEFGHIRISGPELACYCGKAGCIETVASGRAIIRKAQEAIRAGKPTALKNIPREKLNLSAIIRAACADDLFAIELLQHAGIKIGEALSTLIHLFNPKLIVIGGEITEANELITAPIQQAIDKFAFTRMKNQCEIRMSSLKEKACIWGTLTLVMKHLYYNADSTFSLY